jgi:hypothetical protein
MKRVGQYDPFGLDTPAKRRDAKWFAEHFNALVKTETIHLRGFHYILVASGYVRKPNGRLYRNTFEDWSWLQDQAAKPARWLNYVSFDRIVDERNAKPIENVLWIKPFTRLQAPEMHDHDKAVDLLLPTFATPYCSSGQAYRIVLIGEKTSLASVLEPIMQEYGTELVLPSGDISDTLLYGIADRAAHLDDRRLIVLYFSDFDPSGYNMPISAARRLQAFQARFFPSLEFELHRVALTLDQVIEHNLPSTPLKETERRSDKWRAAMGREQTEIDALAALRPDVMEQIARDAIAPFYDETLAAREAEAATEWLAQEDATLAAHPAYQAALKQVAPLLDAAKRAHAELERDDIQPPPIPVVAAVDSEVAAPEPLFTTDDDYDTATDKLLRHKAYETGEHK